MMEGPRLQHLHQEWQEPLEERRGAGRLQVRSPDVFVVVIVVVAVVVAAAAAMQKPCGLVSVLRPVAH